MKLHAKLVAAFFVALAGGIVSPAPPDSASAAVRSRPVIEVRDTWNLESDGQVSIRVSLTQPSTSTVAVHFQTEGRTARSGSDFERTEGVLVFAPGELQAWISPPLVDDRIHEATERFVLKLTRPRHATMRNRRAVVTVLDNDWDGTPAVSPSTDLVDAQTVRIQADDLSAGLVLFAYESEGWVTTATPYGGPCDAYVGSMTVDAHGRLDATVQVRRHFPWYDNIIRDCAVSECSINLRSERAADGNSYGRAANLAFRP